MVGIRINGKPIDFSRDFLIDVQLGKVSGYSMVHKFGRNDGVPNGTWEFINLLGASNGLLSAATTVRIKAGGNAADDVGGAGATEVTIQGIVATTFAEETDTLIPDGANVSAASAKSFWRVHRVWPSGVGTYRGKNIGPIVIENSAGTADLIQINADEGQTFYGGYTIPDGYTGVLLSVHKSVDSTQAADIRMFTADDLDIVSAPMKAARAKKLFTGINAESPYIPKGPDSVLNAKSDIWFEAEGSGGTTKVGIDFEILLVQDGF